MEQALPGLVERLPRLQFIHLTGAADLAAVQSEFRRLGVKALVQVFCTEMAHALGAASLAVTRAGGSTLAELAATRTPAVLVPFPEAADQHQQFNAMAFAESGTAVVVDQNRVSGSEFGSLLQELLEHPERLAAMRDRFDQSPSMPAAGQIVDAMFARLPQVWRAGGVPPVARRRENSDASPSFNPFSSLAS